MHKLIINNDDLFDKVVEILRTGRKVTIPVKGYSMLPFIRGEKDIVVLEGICGGAKTTDAPGADSGGYVVDGAASECVAAKSGDAPGADSSGYVVDGAASECVAAKAAGEGVRRCELRRGDIVLFRFEGRYILHRVLKIKDGVVEIQGDGVYMSKEHCRLEHVYGRVVKILRDGEKEIDPNSAGQRLLVWCWGVLFPVRRYLLAVYRRLPQNRDL